MAISLKHAFQSPVSDGGDANLVQPSDWNDEHDLTMATARLLGRTTAGTGAAEEIQVGDSLSLASGVLSAKWVQEVPASYATHSSTSTVLPVDDTIPQNTEGAEIMTATITPKSATNKLRIDVIVHCNSSGIVAAAMALFQDSTANALAAAFITPPNAAYGMILSLTHVMDAGTTSSTTFKLRAGPGSAGTLYFNGYSGGRLFGGVSKCTMIVTEYTP